MSEAVNEAVEQAHRQGVLSTASLMVAGPAAADAVRRAHALPNLRVGLHLVVIEGDPVLPPAAIPALLDRSGRFPSDQMQLGIRYFFSRTARRQLQAEIAAQFAAFAATGLRLDHANAHKHMHLHPTVGRMMIEAGQRHGLKAIRIPAEKPTPLRLCGQALGLGDHALFHWTRLLRRQARRAGLRTNDHAFGIAWTGHMTTDRVIRLAGLLPPGLSEMYFHPATHADAILQELMPDYDFAGELAALLAPRFARALTDAGVTRTTWS